MPGEKEKEKSPLRALADDLAKSLSNSGHKAEVRDLCNGHLEAYVPELNPAREKAKKGKKKEK